MKNCIWISPKGSGVSHSRIYYFKKSFELDKIGEGVVEISAQSRYRLYINGNFCAFGPCKGTREQVYFDTVNVTEYLKEGKNDIFVEVAQLVGRDSDGGIVPADGVIRTGICALCFELTCGDTVIKADESWLCGQNKSVEMLSGIHAGSASFLEYIDAQKAEVEYENAIKRCDVHNNENDHFWWGGTSNLFLSKRPIPMLKMTEIPISYDGEYYDASYLTFGFPFFTIKGKGKVRIEYFECFGTVNPNTKADRTDRSLGYDDFFVDTVEIDGEMKYSPFWFRCFRFIKVKAQGDVTVTLDRFLEVNYPMPIRTDYDFGRDDDNKLWEISVRTLQRCMHETYEDCPYYEQLQYCMDTSTQMVFNYQLCDDDALARKAMDDFAAAQMANGLMPSRYPCVYDQHIPSFQFYFIFMVYQHYIRFGDLSLVRKHLRAIDGVVEWFTALIDEDGMVGQSKYWNFVDWAKPWVYDQERGCEGGVPLGVYEGNIGLYNPMMAYFLQVGAKLNELCGRRDVAREYIKTANLLIKSTKKYFYDKKTKLFADDVNHIYYSQHMQTWCVLAGVVRGDQAKEIMTLSRNLEAKSTYAFAFFYFRALESCGLYEYTEDMMDSYRNLLKLNCTTVPETPENTRSECHAWGAIAIYEFSATVLGVRTENVAERSISVKPYIKNRDYAKGTVSTIAGDVYVSWKKDNNLFTIEIRSEKDCEKIVYLPDGSVTEIKDKYAVLTCNI